MIQFLNIHAKKFLTVIFFITVVAFAFWGPGSCSKERGGANMVTLGGKAYGEDAKGEAAHIAQLAQTIGFHSEDRNPYAAYTAKGPVAELAKLLMSAGRSKRQDRGNSGQEQLATLVTLRNTAKKMGISVAQAEVDKAIQESSFFQTDKQFDREKFNKLFPTKGDRALAEKQLFTMFKDAIACQKMSELVSAPIEASDFAAEAAYNRQNSILTAQVITLPRKDHESIKAEEKDAKEFYESQKAKKIEEQDSEVVSPASRNIRYVSLNLSDRTEDVSKLDAAAQEAKKKGWDEADAKIRNTAIELYDLVSGDGTNGKGLDAAAEELKTTHGDKVAPVEVKTFANFHSDNMPDEIKSERQVSSEMVLSKNRVGAPKTKKGYIIYEVVKDNPSALLEFDQIKEKLITKLTKDKVEAAQTEKFNSVRNALETALNAKKPWADALTEAKVTATELVINPAKPDPKAPAFQGAVANEVQTMKSNTLAKNAVANGDDKLVVFLSKREIMDSPKRADDIKMQKDNQAVKAGPFENPLFSEWFEVKRDEVYPMFSNE